VASESKGAACVSNGTKFGVLGRKLTGLGGVRLNES
jgi:hypothetical protein